MLTRDRERIPVTYQFPLYPMLSNIDTASSENNHGKVWNTRSNHLGWKFYLRGDAKRIVSPYAAPAHQTDYCGLPPAYTFVGDREPFLDETKDYIRNLRKAGVRAEMDIYHTDIHAFGMLFPKKQFSIEAIRT